MLKILFVVLTLVGVGSQLEAGAWPGNEGDPKPPPVEAPRPPERPGNPGGWA